MLYQNFLDAIRCVVETTYNRDDMPQVDGDDLTSAVDILRSHDISVQVKNIQPGRLKSSQKQVDKNKVRSIIRDIKSGKKMPPIVVSNDWFIVDGHHRKFAYLVTSPKTPIKVLMVDLPIDAAIKAYSAVENLI